jgi:hypothetical protein
MKDYDTINQIDTINQVDVMSNQRLIHCIMQMRFLVTERERATWGSGVRTDRLTEGRKVHAWPGERCRKSHRKEGPAIWGVSIR